MFAKQAGCKVYFATLWESLFCSIIMYYVLCTCVHIIMYYVFIIMYLLCIVLLLLCKIVLIIYWIVIINSL
jgi:hypothetical protein